MGGVTNICTDKTGTLTENRMAVVRGWIGGNEFDGVPKVSNDALRHLLTHGISINSKVSNPRTDYRQLSPPYFNCHGSHTLFFSPGCRAPRSSRFGLRISGQQD